MPTFLWFYASIAVGFVFYFTLGEFVAPTLAKLFGERAGQVWGRSFRMLVVTIALVGGLSTQWYGCEGYADRKAVERSREVMFEKSTEQVASAISYVTWFVVGTAGLGAIMYAMLWRGGENSAGPSTGAPSHDTPTRAPSEANP
jgi:hypothetical protein